MDSSDVWSDFEQVRHNIKNNTVDRLKQILTGLNEECGTHFSKSGKKQEIIDRIVSIFDSWRAANLEDKWTKAKTVVHQVRNIGTYAPSRMPVIPAVLPTTVVPLGMYGVNGINKPLPYVNGTAGPSSIGRYDPYAPPRKPTGSVVPPSAPKPTGIRFKESPFFRVDQAVSGIVECPESSSASDRRQQILSFTLNNDHIAKLKAPESKYQLRLFCTSSIFYTGINGFRTSTLPCLVEFPPTCEVRVNNIQLNANLKGLKKKPGTAPPPDISRYSRISPLLNRIEMVYVNSQQPVPSKKYYLIAMLVEAIAVNQLVDGLKASNYKSAQEIRQKMIDSSTEDEDIVAGPQKMSLKCPLSFMRVNTPCRSSKCVHSQCFDATSWYSMMEQTTTWLCPVCERVLDYKDLIIDGYFDEILQQSPESVEDVIVESNGEWHTSDNKYASAKWKEMYPASVPPPLPPPRKPSSAAPTPSRTPSKFVNQADDATGKAKAKNVEILILDSDDEEEGRVKRELSPSYASSANQSFDGSVPTTNTYSQTSDVIDLTLDSDDDEPLVSKRIGKRRASEADLTTTSPTEQIWKKGRMDPNRNMPSSGTPNGVDHPRHVSTHIPSQPTVHTSTHVSANTSLSNASPGSSNHYSSFPTTTLPPPPLYPVYHGRGSSNSLQLPPLTPYSRPHSGSSRWP